jgi:hypothetical protein
MGLACSNSGKLKKIVIVDVVFVRTMKARGQLYLLTLALGGSQW